MFGPLSLAPVTGQSFQITKSVSSFPYSFLEEFVWPIQPSSHLINALLSLISSLGRLGLSRSALFTKGITTQITQDFQFAVAEKVSVENCVWRRGEAQLLWDLTFLRKISSAFAEDSIEVDDPLTRKLLHLRERVRHAICYNESITDITDIFDPSCCRRYQTIPFRIFWPISIILSISIYRARRHFWLHCSWSQYPENHM